MMLGDPKNSPLIGIEKHFCLFCGRFVSKWVISPDGKYRICPRGHKIKIEKGG